MKSRWSSGIGLQVANIGHSRDLVLYTSLISDQFLAKSLEPLLPDSILSLDMFCHGNYEAVESTVQILLQDLEVLLWKRVSLCTPSEAGLA